MGYLGLAQPLGLSSPASNTQLPFPLFVNGNEISQGVSGADAFTYKLKDPGFSGNQTLAFTIHDHTLAVYPWIARQQRVLWLDSVGNRVLFQGFIKDLEFDTIATWVDIKVTCAQLGEALDFARPIPSWDAAAKKGGSDRTMIQSLLGQFSQESALGAGGFIQSLNSTTMPASLPVDRMSLRNAIDAVLVATGVQNAVAYVDNLGFLHTIVSGDVAAPFTITDAPPPWTTAVPGKVSVNGDGTQDVDAIYVYGGTSAGSGPVYIWQVSSTPARSPLRWTTIDAPQATTAAAKVAAATVEFQRRQATTAVTIVVTGYDGWAKGQQVFITNGALGYVARPFTITAVDMDVISGTGVRRYTITAGANPRRFTIKAKAGIEKSNNTPVPGGRIQGVVGGAFRIF